MTSISQRFGNRRKFRRYHGSVNGEAVKQLARECGFELAGVAAARPASDAEHFLQWVADGKAGRMGYLTDHRAQIREDPRTLLPSAKSIICVGKLYNRIEPYSTHLPSEGWISRYAAGHDYHDVLRQLLENFVTRLRTAYGGFEYKICVDTAPLLERTYARLAGLGWIGKNTCLIHEGQGSWFFLGEILVSLELETDVPVADRCGTCTRCIDACPTDAILPSGDRYEVDARRCISYLTIELKGDIPEELRDGTGANVFGCDICQDVCPWNRTAPVTEEPALLTGESSVRLQQLAKYSEEQFRSAFRKTPVWRAKYGGFLRNVAVAMGNSGRTENIGPLQQLCQSSDSTVASHAKWALDKLQT